jgi:S-adenosylmethionine:diacylglycerol 3-amino-3-carboxypropyl transferase
MTRTALGTAWETGRLDSGRGPPRVLFGRMYEDPAIERAAFAPGGRVFCIASAGCTAMSLAPHHDVVAVDINPAQLDYAAQRIAGAPMVRGTAEHLMRLGRALLPLAGWGHPALRTFLDLDDPATQREFWKARLDTRRFRGGLDALLSVTSLRAAYAPRLLASLPDRFGAVMRARMERCFGTHPNRTNPWARALLAGEWTDEPPPPEARAIRLVQSDAAAFLEQSPPGSFDGFTLSNILDGADDAYRRRLLHAVVRSAAPGAMVVLRSFGEPAGDLLSNRAADDRSILWGIVDVRPASAYGG